MPNRTQVRVLNLLSQAYHWEGIADIVEVSEHDARKALEDLATELDLAQANAVQLVGIALRKQWIPLYPKAHTITLEKREWILLWFVLQGLSNAEITQKLGLSPGTVKNLVSSLHRKLDAVNRCHLVRRAHEYRLAQ